MTDTPIEISQQITRALQVLAAHLGDGLQAVYLFGSAVDGGLQPGSDIDLLVIVHQPLPQSLRHGLMSDLLSVSAWPSTESLRPLEVTVVAQAALVPWRYPPVRELQFGEWLREDLQAGRFEPPMADHDLAILLTKARQHSVCLLGPAATAIIQPIPEADLLRALYDTTTQWNEDADWQDEQCNVVLALARIWLTLATGHIVPKDEAATWLLERLPVAHRPVLETARAVYRGQARDDLASRPRQVAAFVCHARSEIDRLYSRSLSGPGSD
ncbi:aminoglycoside adenylyltransferase family protein [Pseudomonas sp. CCNWLW56]|uniref:aminoglycoside adenylyltransferase family protein n=1 Tax=unclassified Pseudomonas TaxID=196821 RepID=UPI00307831B5